MMGKNKIARKRCVERIPLYGEDEKPGKNEAFGLYEITVYEINGTKRTRLSAMEVQAKDPMHALELASAWVKANRAVEIRQLTQAEIPKEN